MLLLTDFILAHLNSSFLSLDIDFILVQYICSFVSYVIDFILANFAFNIFVSNIFAIFKGFVILLRLRVLNFLYLHRRFHLLLHLGQFNLFC